MRRTLDVLAQQIPSEVAVEVPPDRVNVVRIVLRVVVLDQERQPLNSVVMGTAVLGFARPLERDLLDARLAKLVA